MVDIILPGIGEENRDRTDNAVRSIAARLADYAPLVSPSFTTPSLGVATATSINKVAITPVATGATITMTDGKTLSASNTLTLAGTDSSTLNIGAGGTLAALAFLGAAPAGTLTGTTLAAGVVTSSLTTVGTIGTGVWQSTAIGPGYGGTGITTYTTGDILYASAANTLAKLAAGTDGYYLKLASGVPTWAANEQTWTVVKKTADQAITSNTTLADDTYLQFSMAANTTYAIRFMYFITSGAGGINIGANGPSSPTKLRFSNFVASGSTTPPGLVNLAVVYGSLWSTVPTSPTIAIGFDGVIQNGANAGTFAVQVAQNTSNAAATTFEKGSYLEYAIVA